MRTTLSIDEDVLKAARAIARLEGTSLGAVISRLARRGLAPRATAATEGDFPVFAVPRDARPITPEMVRSALED